MSLQAKATDWALRCFGPEIVLDLKERGFRFVEEALELGQLVGLTSAEAHALVEYVYGRPTEVDPYVEVGGVLVTLAVLCHALQMDMDEAGEREIARCERRIELIRAKQAAKTLRSGPLPGYVNPLTVGEEVPQP